MCRSGPLKSTGEDISQFWASIVKKSQIEDGQFGSCWPWLNWLGWSLLGSTLFLAQIDLNGWLDEVGVLNLIKRGLVHVHDQKKKKEKKPLPFSFFTPSFFFFFFSCFFARRWWLDDVGRLTSGIRSRGGGDDVQDSGALGQGESRKLAFISLLPSLGGKLHDRG